MTRIGKASADDDDFDGQAEVLPVAVGGVNGGFSIKGESEAGAIAERKAEGPRLCNEFSSQMRLFLIEEAHLTSHLVNAASDPIQWHPAKRQDGVDFSQVDCAQQSTVKKIGDLLGSRLLKNDGQDCR